jgi:hypothetical protein
MPNVFLIYISAYVLLKVAILAICDLARGSSFYCLMLLAYFKSKEQLRQEMGL